MVRTILAACCIALSAAAHAQDLAEYDGEHGDLQAAIALTEVAYTGSVMTAFAEQAAQEMIRHQPPLAEHYGTVQRFFREHMPEEELQNHMARLYAERFSSEELDRMREFYGTETGRKALVSTPAFLQAAAYWMVRETRDREDILRTMINEQSPDAYEH